MIKVRLQIEDGTIEDTYEKWGFIYMDADERTAPDEKKPDSTSYAEEAGEHQDSRRVADAFDYTARFLIEAPNRNLVNANSKIAAFNTAIRESKNGTDVKRAKEVTFYNDFNRVKIVGYPEQITVPTDFYRRQDGSVMDCAQFELKIRVSDPRKCEFDLATNI